MAAALPFLTVLIALLALLGGPLAAYVAVRVGLATVTTKLDDSLHSINQKIGEVGTRLDKLDTHRDNHSVEIATLKVLVSGHETRIGTLETAGRNH